MVPFITVLEVLGQFMRLISLSVRLFANMLAGHILILTFIGLMFVLETVALAVVSVPVATIFYLLRSSSSSRSRPTSSPPCPPSTSARRSSPTLVARPTSSTGFWRAIRLRHSSSSVASISTDMDAPRLDWLASRTPEFGNEAGRTTRRKRNERRCNRLRRRRGRRRRGRRSPSPSASASARSAPASASGTSSAR